MRISRISPDYLSAIGLGVVIQLPLLLLAALLLDGGRAFSMICVAMLAYWSATVGIIIRRPREPKASDLVFIRWGPLFVLAIAGLLAPIVWLLIGESHLNGLERLLQ